MNLVKKFLGTKKTWLPTFGNVHEFVPLWRCLVGYPPKDVASLWPFCTKRRSILIIIFVFGRLVGRFNSSNFQCRWIEQMRRKKKEKKNRCCRHNEAVWDCRRELDPRRFLFSIETGPSSQYSLTHTQIESNWILSWKYGVRWIDNFFPDVLIFPTMCCTRNLIRNRSPRDARVYWPYHRH